MNIFFLSWIPKICALYHVDKHVVKMILESCQLLCSAHHITESKYKAPYKLTHKNHPCSIWTRTSLANYNWLIEMSLELCKEYTYRYGKVHKCQAYIEELKINPPPIEDIGLTTPKLAMPDIYKDDNPVMAYRQYYFFEKKPLHYWKNRKTPKFIIKIEKLFILIYYLNI